MGQNLAESKLFVGGSECPAESGATYEIYNPARPQELVGHAALASVNDVNMAVSAASAAFADWSSKTVQERAKYLNEVAKVLSESPSLEGLSQLFTREHGKVHSETFSELTRFGSRFELVASFADRLASTMDYPADPKWSPYDTQIIQQPRGVAALVIPWNWPLSILATKLPHALLAGNTVVVKLAQNSAIVPSQMLRLVAEKLPKGVLNIITGSARQIGDALVGHPKVRTVNFTGSIEVGQHVMRVASENLSRVTLELGGNDPAIVLPDADLNNQTFQKMYKGVFTSSGQVCMAIKRLFVHASRYDEVVEGMLSACNATVVGDGTLKETTMGPVNNAAQLKIVNELIAQASLKGAEVIECGQIPDEDLYDGGGYFKRPTLVLNADPDLSVVKEEQFGPVLPIIKYNTEDEAIKLANDGVFGLCSSVWTSDSDRGLRIAKQIEAGYTFLNNHGATALDGRAPFGGFKYSGIGRNLGYEGILGFLEAHSLSGPAGSIF